MIPKKFFLLQTDWSQVTSHNAGVAVLAHKTSPEPWLRRCNVPLCDLVHPAAVVRVRTMVSSVWHTGSGSLRSTYKLNTTDLKTPNTSKSRT